MLLTVSVSDIVGQIICPAYFNNGITNYPESSRLALMHSGLGDAYLKAGNNKKAIEHIEKAIAIAKINSDTDLKKYESKLLELRR